MKLLLTITALYFLILPSNPTGKLNEIPAINYGGCGWVALYLSEQLPSASIEVTGNWDHVFVRWQGRMIDSRGIWGPLFPIRGKEVTREQLRERLMRRELWNPEFDIKDTIRIKMIINPPKGTIL